MTNRLAQLALFVVLAVAMGCGSSLLGGRKAAKPRFFELRTYTTHEGKLDALHARFRDHTNRLFQKQGMELIGYWTPADEPRSADTLIYVLAYRDLAHREAAWKGFKNDPEWKKAFAESRKDGPIVKKVVSQFMTATDYSDIR
ncbi:MAG: NIPSNAP family protein [Phycisphaerae bacterium]|nr:NIPSNAP family protein [Phycisphaerae bacterium]